MQNKETIGCYDTVCRKLRKVNTQIETLINKKEMLEKLKKQERKKRIKYNKDYWKFKSKSCLGKEYDQLPFCMKCKIRSTCKQLYKGNKKTSLVNS